MNLARMTEVLKEINKVVQEKTEEEMDNYPIRVKIQGLDMDIDLIDRTGGEINIYIKALYCADNGKSYELKEVV